LHASILPLDHCDLMILNKLVYLLMLDVDPDVMNMFTQDYGLTAAELSQVTHYY